MTDTAFGLDAARESAAREIELQALASLAALTLSAAHFLKSHQLLVQKFAADPKLAKWGIPFDGAAAPNARSLSRMRCFGAVSHGNASVIWRANHSVVGLRVTANHSNCRRL